MISRTLFFILLAPCLTALALPHPEWTVQSVDATQTPFGTSLVFDSAGVPFVSFRGNASQSLFVSRFDGVNWITTEVDATANVGTYSSLALDGSGHPAVSYNDGTNNDLKFARYDGTMWNVETVDSIGSVGTYTSLAFNPSGRPVIAYKSQTNEDLKLAEWTGTQWTITNVPVTGLIGSFASLAFTPGGEPAIAYFDSGASDLEYVERNAGTWTMTPIDTTGNVGRYASLAFGGDGRPAIAYHDQTNGTLKLARFDGTTWKLEVVDSAGIVGTDASLKFTPGGQPAISYYDTTNSSLKYAEYDGTAWQKVTVTNDGSLGVFSSLAFGVTGEPSITFANSPTGVGFASRIPPTPKITWIGPVNGLWSDPANWSPRAPVATDEVCILTGGSVILDAVSAAALRLIVDGTLTISGGSLLVQETVTGTGSIQIAGGEIEVVSSTLVSSIQTLTISSGEASFQGDTMVLGLLTHSGGTVIVGDALSVEGTYRWEGGTLNGSGTLEIIGITEINGGTTAHTASEVQIITGGSATWAGGDVVLEMGATWTHEGGGDFVWSASGGTWSSGPSETLMVQGELIVQGGGMVTFQGHALVVSTGSVQITGTSLVETTTFLVSGGELQSQGPVTVERFGILQFTGGSFEVESSVTVSSEALFEMTSGTLLVQGGSLMTSGDFEWSGGTIEVTNTGTVDIPAGGQWIIDGETGIYGDDSSATEVSGTITVEGGGEWQSQQSIIIHAGGKVEIVEGQILMDGAIEVEDGGTLMVEGLGELSMVMCEVQLEGGSTLMGAGTIELAGGYYVNDAGARYLVLENGDTFLWRGPPDCRIGYYQDGDRCLRNPTSGVNGATGDVTALENFYVSFDPPPPGEAAGGEAAAPPPALVSCGDGPALRVRNGATVGDFVGTVEAGSSFSRLEGASLLAPAVRVVFENQAGFRGGDSGVFYNERPWLWSSMNRWQVAVRDHLDIKPPGVGIPGIDQIHTPIELYIDATPANPFIIALNTHSTPGTPGPLSNFDPAVPWSFLLVLGDVIGDVNAIRVDPGNWVNDRSYGHFGVERRVNGLYLVYTPSPFQKWMAQHFSLAERLNQALNSPTADFDGDGEVEVIEFLRNHNPRAADQAGPYLDLFRRPGEDRLNLALSFPEDPVGLKFELQTSKNLSLWENRFTLHADGTPVLGNLTDGHTMVLLGNGYEYRVDLAGKEQSFVRMKITPEDPWWTSPGLPPE